MRKIEDKKELMKLCSFIVMGDGGVYKYNGNKECSFVMNMIADNEDYVLLCRDILENITTCRIVLVEKEGNRKPQLRLTSKGHPFFTKLRERIYLDKYKSIDQHALKLLDYEALSFLYMSDGSLVMKKGKYPTVTLNLKRLSYGDLYFLKKALKDKLDLEWNINKNYPYFYLNLRSKDIPKFMSNIRQYITPSFMYKILDEVPSNKNEVVI
jgi:hypothetical protein